MVDCPVLVITDVGKDVDDTLALLYLAHLHMRRELKLVGIVTTGGRNKARAFAARAILHSVNIPCVLSSSEGPGIPVVAGRNMSCLGENVVHVEVDGVNFGVHGFREDPHSDAAPFLEQLLQRYAGKLRVVGLGPLTDLVECCARPERFHSVYLQGQVLELVEPLLPSPDAFNFKCDMNAACAVFAALSPVVPFVLLGKHAAYTVGITPQNFESWDRLSGCRLNLKQTVLNGLAQLRNDSPDVYARIFGKKGLDELEYFSRPYDPMLCVLLHPRGYRYFEPTILGQHLLLGGSAANPGVKNSAGLHSELVAGISDTLSKANSTIPRNFLVGSRALLCVAFSVVALLAWRSYKSRRPT